MIKGNAVIARSETKRNTYVLTAYGKNTLEGGREGEKERGREREGERERERGREREREREREGERQRQRQRKMNFVSTVKITDT